MTPEELQIVTNEVMAQMLEICERAQAYGNTEVVAVVVGQLRASVAGHAMRAISRHLLLELTRADESWKDTLVERIASVCEREGLDPDDIDMEQNVPWEQIWLGIVIDLPADKRRQFWMTTCECLIEQLRSALAQHNGKTSGPFTRKERNNGR